MNGTRYLRDVVTLAAGLALVLSQVIIQFQGGEPNVAMLTAGAGLLAGYPLIKAGDRRSDSDDRDRQDRQDHQNRRDVPGGDDVVHDRGRPRGGRADPHRPDPEPCAG